MTEPPAAAGRPAGVVEVTRQLPAPREVVYEAWTALEHRRAWFAGPAWVEIERRLDLRVGGTEIAHGRIESGIESRYTAQFHLIEPPSHLVYAFDMEVAGVHFSVSLADVRFAEAHGGTLLTYTEFGVFLGEGYDAASRQAGTEGLIDQFVAHVTTLPTA